MDARGGIRHKPQRVWRFHLASLELLRRGHARGEELQVWLGHAVHLLMLLRPGLSLPWKVYQFAREHEDRRGRLWPSVKKEIRAVACIVFLTEADLALPLHSSVNCGDASKLGFDMMVTTATRDEILPEVKFRERRRFIEEEERPVLRPSGAGLTPVRGQAPFARAPTRLGEDLREFMNETASGERAAARRPCVGHLPLQEGQEGAEGEDRPGTRATTAVGRPGALEECGARTLAAPGRADPHPGGPHCTNGDSARRQVGARQTLQAADPLRQHGLLPGLRSRPGPSVLWHAGLHAASRRLRDRPEH